MAKSGFVYILASERNGTLYTGVTSNLMRRIWEHKVHRTKGFVSRYSVHTLVYYESYPDIQDALRREKQLKNWKREWKLDLIETLNPSWKDLYDDLSLYPDRT